MSTMNELYAKTLHTIDQIKVHKTELSFVLTAMLDAIIKEKCAAEKWASKVKALYE